MNQETKAEFRTKLLYTILGAIGGAIVAWIVKLILDGVWTDYFASPSPAAVDSKELARMKIENAALLEKLGVSEQQLLSKRRATYFYVYFCTGLFIILLVSAIAIWFHYKHRIDEMMNEVSREKTSKTTYPDVNQQLLKQNKILTDRCHKLDVQLDHYRHEDRSQRH